jgi:hypothetical protein
MRVARGLGPGHTVVTVLCDGAGRYAGKLYNTKFLATRGLPQPPWLQHPMQLPDGLLEMHHPGAQREAQNRARCSRK